VASHYRAVRVTVGPCTCIWITVSESRLRFHAHIWRSRHLDPHLLTVFLFEISVFQTPFSFRGFETKCPDTLESCSSNSRAVLLTCSMFSRFLVSPAVAAWAIISVLPVISCGPTSPHDIFPRTPAAGIDVKTLAPYLSSAAKIYLPGSTEFTTYTVRWSNLEPPTPNVVIVPGTAKDVAKIVNFSSICFERSN
jgi:hypothetical protein